MRSFFLKLVCSIMWLKMALLKGIAFEHSDSGNWLKTRPI